MAAALFDLLAVLLVLVVLRARPSVVLALLGASVLLVPGPFGVPHSPTTLLTFPHLITLAGAGRVVLGLIDRTVTREHLRLTSPQAALLGLLAVAGFVGVVVAPTAGPLGAAQGRLADVVDHLLFLTVALVLTRQAGPRAALNGMALGLLAGLLVSCVEHVTGDSYGHMVFGWVHDIHQSASFPLGRRGGSVRVRAGTEFALQFAWIVAMLAPALVVAAWRRGGLVLGAAAGLLCTTCVYWSFARTALAATAVAVVVTLAVLARRSAPWVVVSSASLAAAALLSSAALRAHLDPNSDIGSVHERARRLGPVLDLVSHHPFRGVGLGNLTESGFRTTDFAYLIAYVEMGVIGVVAVFACLLFALRAVVPGLLVRDPHAQADALVATGCVGMFVLSTFAYDAFTLVQGTHALWLGTALGVVALEHRAPWAPPLRWSGQVVGRALGAAVLGLVAGLVVLQLAPRHVAVQGYFQVLTQQEETRPQYDPLTYGRRFVNSVCGIVRANSEARTRITCSDTFGAAGVGQLRVQAPNSFLLRRALADIDHQVTVTARLSTFRFRPSERQRSGRDTWARTAPVWGALSAAVLALVLSPSPAAAAARARRRRGRGAPGAADATHEPAPRAPARR